jgi:hypothetical protein
MRTISDYLDMIETRNFPNFNRENFLIYLDYMLYRKGDEPKIEVKSYYRHLYKYIEMLIEEDLLE